MKPLSGKEIDRFINYITTNKKVDKIELKRIRENHEEVKKNSCVCGENIKPHACPFKQEIEGDTKTLCKCCNLCTYRCERDT